MFPGFLFAHPHWTSKLMEETMQYSCEYRLICVQWSGTPMLIQTMWLWLSCHLKIRLLVRDNRVEANSQCFIQIKSVSFLTLEPIQSLFHSSISLFIWRLYLLCNSIHSLNATFYYLYLCSRLFGGQPVLQQQPITQSNTSHWKSAAETLHLQVSTWQKCVTTAYKRRTI